MKSKNVHSYEERTIVFIAVIGIAVSFYAAILFSAYSLGPIVSPQPAQKVSNEIIVDESLNDSSFSSFDPVDLTDEALGLTNGSTTQTTSQNDSDINSVIKQIDGVVSGVSDIAK